MNFRYRPFEMTGAQILESFEKLDPVIVSDQLSQLQVLQLHLNNQVEHVVQKSNLAVDGEIFVSQTMMSLPVDFINFPISSILSTEMPTREEEDGFTLFSRRVERLDEKSSVLTEVESCLRKWTQSTALISDILLVADEIVSNCFHHAPAESQGRPQISLGRNAERFVLVCRDFHGTLDVEHLLHTIRSCYELGADQAMKFSPGGAGLGSYLVFEACVSLYVAVESGVTSIVGCSFPLRLSTSRRKQTPKNLHVKHFEGHAI